MMKVSGYNLSWSTFSRHLSQLSRELHSEKYFSDVTLVSDDLVQTEAHRIILSASSPLLKSLLTISPRGQTQLFLKGVKHQQLEAVLKFLYYGEVQVPSAEINEFLRAGEELEITELMCIMKKGGDGRDELTEKKGISEDESYMEDASTAPEKDVSENVFDVKAEEKDVEIEAEGPKIKITEELLISASTKIKRIWDLKDESGYVLESKYRSSKLWPKALGVDDQSFIKVTYFVHFSP